MESMQFSKALPLVLASEVGYLRVLIPSYNKRTRNEPVVSAVASDVTCKLVGDVILVQMDLRNEVYVTQEHSIVAYLS